MHPEFNSVDDDEFDNSFDFARPQSILPINNDS